MISNKYNKAKKNALFLFLFLSYSILRVNFDSFKAGAEI